MSFYQDDDRVYVPFMQPFHTLNIEHASKYVEPRELDPSKAERCTDTIATTGGHECRVNKFTREVFDRVGRELFYVCRSTGDRERDVESWARFLVGVHAIKGDDVVCSS